MARLGNGGATIHQGAFAMTQLHAETLQFLTDLRANNDRAWFDRNKPRFLAAKADFAAFIGVLIGEVAKFDAAIAPLEPKDCIFRIYRDTRFSKDKTPYKSSLGAHLIAGGRKNERGRAGYYVLISPGDCFLAGGAHLPSGNWMAEIRQEICDNGDDLRCIVGSSEFAKYFGGIEGEKLKTAPRGYAKDHPEIELLKYKSFLAVHRMSEEEAISPGFLKHAAKVFKALQPFAGFLNQRAPGG